MKVRLNRLPWTAEEDGRLKREVAERTPLDQIVGKIDRTEAAIRNRAYILGLRLGRLRKPGESKWD